MAVIDKKTYAVAKRYTDTEVAGGGAIKGKNCTIDSISPITGGNRVTFKWTLDNGTVQTGTMDVMDGTDGAPGATGAQGPQGPAGPSGADGADGLGIKSVDIDANNHLIITYDDNTIHDAGEIPGGGGEVISVNDKKGIVILYATDIKMSNDPNAKPLSVAIHDLDLLVASKVDKVPGKGLSTNDFTNELKDKVVALENIYMIGSGLNLDPLTGKLTASGIETPIDTQLDPTSPNPVQNKAIAVPVEALQGSMANVKLDIQHLQGSMANVYTKAQVDAIADALKNGRFKVVNVLPTTDISMTTIYLVSKSTAFSNNVYDEYICTDNTTTPATWELIGDTQIDLSDYAKTADVNTALDGKVDKVNGKGLSTNDYDAAAKTIVDAIPLQMSALQGSVLDIKLDVDQLAGSLANKADKTELDEWVGTATVDANGDIEFDNLDDTKNYDVPYFQNKFVKITGMTKGTGTQSGTIKLTYHTDATSGMSGKLRIIK